MIFRNRMIIFKTPFSEARGTQKCSCSTSCKTAVTERQLQDDRISLETKRVFPNFWNRETCTNPDREFV